MLPGAFHIETYPALQHSGRNASGVHRVAVPLLRTFSFSRRTGTAVFVFLTLLCPHRLRRDGRSNGTAILRRSSTTPFNNQTTTLPAIDNSLTAAVHDAPASIPSPYFAAPDAAHSKYTKDDLLQLGKMADSRHVDVNALMMAGFSPVGHVNGNAPRGWGKSNDAHAHNDPTVCWDSNGDLGPLGHQEMSSEEKEVGTSLVHVRLLPRHSAC